MDNVETLSNHQAQDDITFAALGITPRAVVKETLLGKVRSCDSIMKKEWIFLSISTISILTCIGITIQRLSTLPKDSQDSTLALILLFNTVFSLFYIIHGTLFERPYELAVFLSACVIVTLYCVIEYVVHVDGRNDIKLARLIVVSIFILPIILLGLMIAKEYYLSANLIFRTVGANSDLQSACWTIFLYEDLLKFDFQLAITMIIMILQDLATLTELEEWIVGIGVPLSVLWMLFSLSVVRFESLYLLSSSVITGFLQPAYVIYKMYNTAQNVKDGLHWDLPSFVFTAGSISLVLRLTILLLLICKVRKNFGRGLREKVYGEKACCVEKADDLAVVSSST